MKSLNTYVEEYNETVNEKLYEMTDEDKELFNKVVEVCNNKKSELAGFIRQLLNTCYFASKNKNNPDIIKGAQEFIYAVEK